MYTALLTYINPDKLNFNTDGTLRNINTHSVDCRTQATPEHYLYKPVIFFHFYTTMRLKYQKKDNSFKSCCCYMLDLYNISIVWHRPKNFTQT